MRKLLSAGLVMVLSLIPTMVLAAPGPEPGSPDFDIFFRSDTDGVVDTTSFSTSDGWDFGNRIGYNCAYVEFYRGGVLLFEVHYETLINDGSYAVRINDRNGQEVGPDKEMSQFCGDGVGPGPSLPYSEADHGDHHPHGDFTDSSDLVFYFDANGDGLRPDDEVARIDYSAGDFCDEAYWTPGNSPGEAVFWWDDDGPTEGMPGVPLPGCTNGDGEPTPVVLATVRNVAEGVAYCVTDAMDGDLCGGAEFEPEVTPVTLGSGLSELACPDGSTPAVVQIEPLQVSCP